MDSPRQAMVWREQGTTYILTDDNLTPEQNAAVVLLTLPALSLGRLASGGMG